jgi:hypothetical protein
LFGGPQMKNRYRLLLTCALLALSLRLIACSGQDFGVLQPQDLCKCLPVEPDIADYRHAAKHVPISNMPPVEIMVTDILGWPQDPLPLPIDQPRTGRELQVFRLANAFLQEASVNSADCDVHMEISQTADKNAPRVIIETPVDSEFCSARQQIQSQLKQHNFRLDSQHGGELPSALPLQVLGLAFEDFDHNRGSAQVVTIWELHPATVNILP